tara:strand:- start:10343 stop:11176 length:834 start_codon:yes stop_codon:yes gene_type:complete
MRKIKIKDTSFQHCEYSNNPMPPVSFCEHFKWDWDTSVVGVDELIFYTHSNIMEGVSDTNGKKVCWLIEPLELVGVNYEEIKQHHNEFEYVFTHEKTLLDLGENFKFMPFGGCWIKSEDQKIYNKTKLVSITSSWKRQMEGHLFRHQIISNFGHMLDTYGNGYTPIVEKVDGHRDYMFSVIIENCKRDYWFTEKLIDCLMTGTVPIYWGCPSIGDFFNTKGFLIINDLGEVGEALNELTPELYEEMRPYIEENFEKSKQFVLGENTIHNEYLMKGLL